MEATACVLSINFISELSLTFSAGLILCLSVKSLNLVFKSDLLVIGRVVSVILPGMLLGFPPELLLGLTVP